MQIKISEQCDRCPREILRNVDIDTAVAKVKEQHKPVPPALEVKVGGKVIASYKRLCDECEGICGAALEGVKPQAKKSARRQKKGDSVRPERAAE